MPTSTQEDLRVDVVADVTRFAQQIESMEKTAQAGGKRAGKAFGAGFDALAAETQARAQRAAAVGGQQALQAARLAGARHGQKLAAELATEGGKAGRKLAERLTAEFNQRIASGKQLRFEGKIDDRTLRARGREAAHRFNAALIAGLQDLKVSGAIDEREFTALSRRLRAAGLRSGQSYGQGVEQGARAGMGSLLNWVRGIFAIQLGQLVGRAIRGGVAYLRETATAALEVEKSYLRLQSAAKLYGVEQSVMNQLSERGRKEMQLTVTTANELAIQAARIAGRAGEAARAQELWAAALDLGAANGLKATEAALALEQSFRGVDEGLNRLGLADPSFVYREFAQSIGSTADALTDAQKQQAIMTAIIEGASKVQGEYQRQLDGNIGKMTAWENSVRIAKETIGGAFLPVLVNLTEWFSGPMSTAVSGITALFEGLLSPMERLARRMEQIGQSSELILPVVLEERIANTRSEIEGLQAEIDEMTAPTVGNGFLPGAVRGNPLAGLSAARLRDLRDDLLVRQAKAAAAGNKAFAQGLADRVIVIKRLIAAQDDLEEKNRQLAASEAALATAEEKRDLRIELTDIERQIEAIERQGGAYNELRGELDKLLARQAELQAMLGGGTSEEPATGGGEGGAEEVAQATLRQIESARAALEERVRAFQALAPLREMGGGAAEVPAGLEAQLQRIYAIDTEIAAINREINDARGEAPAGIGEVIGALEQERALLRENVAATRNQWANLPEIEAQVARVVESTQAIAGAAVDMGADGWQTLSGAIGGVTRALRESAEAEAELQRARLAGDPRRIAEALERQRRAQRDVADATERTTRIFEAAAAQGIINQEQLNTLIAEMVKLLGDAGVGAENFGKEASSWEKTASTVEGIARGVLSVADALGVLSDEQEQVLRGFVDIASAATRIAGGDVIGGIAQGVGGLIGVIQGAFGSETNPEDAARIERHRDAMRDLEVALLELRDAYLGNLSRTQLEEARQFAQNTAATLGADFGPGTLAAGPMLRGNAVFRRRLEELDEAFGLGLSQLLEDEDYEGLQEALEELGVEIDAQIAKLGQFPETIAGVFDEIGFQFRALGNTDAAERLAAVNERVKELGLSAGEFQDEIDRLTGLDLNTEAGQAERDRIIADIIEEMGQGNADFGNFTPDQFRDFIEQWGTAGVLPTPEAAGPEPVDTTVADTIARVRFELDALGETDAAVRIRRIVDELREVGISFGEFGDELAALDALDLSTAEGQARQGELIAQIIRGMAAEGANLGGLSPDQLRQLVLDYARAAGDAAPEPAGETVSRGVDRSVTETTMRREVSLLTTIAYWNEQSARTLARMAGGSTSVFPSASAMLLQSSAPLPVDLPRTAPPTLRSLGLQPAASTTVNNNSFSLGDLHLTVQSTERVDDAAIRKIADAVSDAQVERIDRALAGRARDYERAAGSYPRSRR